MAGGFAPDRRDKPIVYTAGAGAGGGSTTQLPGWHSICSNNGKERKIS